MATERRSGSFVSRRLALRHHPCQPDEDELERQSSPREKLFTERPVAPIPRHVEVGGVDRNEQHDRGKRTNSPGARHKDKRADDEFRDPTCIGPESF